MASWRLLLFLSFLATLLVIGEAYDPVPCAKDAVHQCVSSLIWNDTQTTPSTPMDPQRFCDTVKEAGMCVYEKHCKPDNEGWTISLVILGVKGAYMHICASNKTDITEYMPRFPEILKAVGSNVEKCKKESFTMDTRTSSNTSVCRAYNNHFSCVYKWLNKTYKPDVAFGILAGGLIAAHRPVYKAHQCMLGRQEDRCSKVAMDYCGAMFMSIKPPMNETQFDYYCWKMVDVFQCYHAIKCRRDTKEHALWQAHINMTMGALYQCSGKAKEVVLEKYECLQDAYHKYHPQCNETHTPTTSNPSNETMCKAANDFVKCMYDGIAADCGEKGAHVLMTVHVKKTRPKLHMKYNCKLKFPDNCNPIAISHCADKVHRVKMPRMKEDFEHNFCWELKEGEKCFKSLMCNRTAKNFTQWQGMLNATKGRLYKCSEDVKGAVLQDYKCVTEKFDESWKSCNKTKNKPPTTDNKAICAAVNNMTKCMYDKIKSKCNRRAAGVVMMSHIKAQRPRMHMEHACKLDADFIDTVTDGATVAVADMSAIFLSTLVLLLTMLARRD